MGQIGGLWRQQAGIDRSIFRQRALQTADAAGHSKDFVAAAEGRNIGADCFDHPHKIDAQDCRQRLASVTGLPGTDFQIERIDRAGLDPDQGLAVPRFWTRDRRDPKRRTMAVKNRRLHSA
jgi:hypothetical protein